MSFHGSLDITFFGLSLRTSLFSWGKVYRRGLNHFLLMDLMICLLSHKCLMIYLFVLKRCLSGNITKAGQTTQWVLQEWTEQLTHGHFNWEYAQQTEAELRFHTKVSTLLKNQVLNENIVVLDGKSVGHDGEHKERKLLLLTSWQLQVKSPLNLVRMFSHKNFVEEGYTCGGLKLLLCSYQQVINMRDKVQQNINLTFNNSGYIFHEMLMKKRETSHCGSTSLWCLNILGKEEKDQPQMLVYLEMRVCRFANTKGFQVKHKWRLK
ncbi:unnamed protein product [Cochlearia groenlandica]